ncbi:hypothetical protein IAD21_00400 [Abditibacteriota bacterium]|nr:hypothetical protein IAD21_00400 [Abditibacteriota bacterium]
MKVLLVGDFVSWSVAMEISYRKAFEAIGCEVLCFDINANINKHCRLGRVGRTLNRFLPVEPWIRKANVELLQMADTFAPDLLVVIATSGVLAGILAQIKVRVPTVSLVCIYPDGPYNLNQERIACLPFFDIVAPSSPAWCDAFEKLGARIVKYLPFGVDETLRSPAPTSERNAEFAHDVTFIGNWRPEREEFLAQLADFDLAVWGGDAWKKRARPDSLVSARWGGRALMGAEFALACAQSRIMLNVMDSATWPGPNMRVFEQAACRAFSLTTRSSAMTDLFEEGQTIECFDSVEEAREKIRFYLEHEDARQRIANASYDFVKKGHTYADRAQQLVNWSSELRENAASRFA